MKVLTFCSYFDPEIAASMYLTLNLLEDAAKEGIEVEVYAPTPTRGVSKDTIKAYRKIKNEIRYNGKVKIHRFSMMQENKNVLFRATRYLLVTFVFFIKGLMSDADVMFIDSTPPTQGIMAALLKKIKKIPYVYNLQDIFPDSLVHTGISKEDSLAWKIGRIIENITYKNADRIIAISEDFKTNIMNKGVPEEKISVIGNWVDEHAVYNVKRDENPLFDRYGLSRNKFYVAYSGNIGYTQNMELLVEVAEKIQTEENIAFVIIGDGAYKQELEEIILEKEIGNIILLPFQPYEDIANVFSLGNMGLIISKAGVSNNSVPSKTWSYMAAEVPVLVSFDLNSDLVTLINDIGCGICVNANDANSLEKAILLAYSDDKHIEHMGNKGRQYINEYLSRKKNTEKYIEIWKQVYRETNITKKEMKDI